MEEVEFESAREQDDNGYITIKDNPIIRAGVFQYKGSSLPDADPNQIYNVYRPLEELIKPETIASFAGLPIIDDHEMVGGKYPRGAEERGVHGSTLENIGVRGLDILAPLRIFSRTLKRLIDSGKKGLSLGYKCRFEKSCGEFAGIAYNYIQRDIRGNHLALVTQGRNGTAVLDEHDVLDEFDLALDNGETTMAEENKGEEKTEESKAPELTLAEVVKFLKAHAPMWQEVQTLMGGANGEGDEDTALDGDTEEKSGDQKAEDGDDKKDEKEEKKDAMDANDVKTLIESGISAARKTLMKSVMADAAERDKLAKELVPHIGTFACDSMDADEVAAYGNEKLGLGAAKGQERAAIAGFLAGAKKNAGVVTYAMDSAVARPKQDGKLAQRLAADA